MRGAKILLAALLVWFCPAPAAVAAEAYPSRSIRLVIPFPPGGTSDTIGRVVAEGLGQALGVPVVVDNRGGAGGALGSETVATAAPDGHTLLQATGGTHGALPHVMPHLPYDPLRSFTPISAVAESFTGVGVSPDLPVRSVQELVDYARRHPGQVYYGTAGVGSVGHFLGELLRVEAGIEITHVPYRGSSLAMNDLAVGRVQLMFDPLVMPQAEAGRIRILAFTNARRWPGLPEIPTMQEAGFPGFVSAGGFFLLGPAGLPPAIVDRLNAAVAEFLAAPAARERLMRAGTLPKHSTPEQLSQDIAAGIARYGEIKRRANLTFE